MCTSLSSEEFRLRSMCPEAMAGLSCEWLQGREAKLLAGQCADWAAVWAGAVHRETGCRAQQPRAGAGLQAPQSGW